MNTITEFKKNKFKGITHLLDKKNMTSRGLWTKLKSNNYHDYKTYDLFWWVTSGKRQPKDTIYYILFSKILEEPLETILECYSNKTKSIFN